ncbi:MAG: HEPN domain-containing protein [Nitrospirae bacterium]|nr:HEPN domain-containing protein [Nitrospirota bacterium]
MEPDVKNWLDIAEYDITTADAMYKSGRYLYVLFMCQQAVEKTLKGLVVQETGTLPPKTHDLERLVLLSGIVLDDKQIEFLNVLTDYYIATRYPEDIAELSKDVDKNKAHTYLKETEGFLAWLRQKLK